MANKIILKKSSVPAKVPAQADLDYGELALNYADGKIYYKTAIGNIESLFDSGTTSVDRLTNGSYNLILQSDGSVKLPSSEATLADGIQQFATPSLQVLDSFSINEYRTVKYLIQAIAGPHSHSTEVMLTHNGVDAFLSEYGTTFSDFNLLLNITATVEENVVKLKVLPIFSGTTVSFYKTSMTPGTLSGIIIEGDLELQAGTVDLMLGNEVFDLQA
jgi:hypothetical protein